MARQQTAFKCQNCDYVAAKWSGKCPSCGDWDSLLEVTMPASVQRAGHGAGAKPVLLTDLQSTSEPAKRLCIGVEELDRVFGGGIVSASATLMGGEPGIGKSTLLLQAAARLAREGRSVIYVSGEEAAAQIQERAERLKLAESPVKLAIETDTSRILATLEAEKPDLVVIDSIQTLMSDSISAVPGSVSQVRACAQILISWAKQSGTAIILVGHVTKDGQIAGPRVVEHLVDTVLHFEGEPNHVFRVLRARKNRFGPTDEIGLFEMHKYGLAPASDPSKLFVSDDKGTEIGTGIFPAMEGTRVVLVEVQALLAQSEHGVPRRSVVGWEAHRLSMILAVLQSHTGLNLNRYEIYLNVTGGYRLQDPAADFAIAATLISAFKQRALPPKTIFVGEMMLSGRLRPASKLESRLKEAARLGFSAAFVPSAGPTTKSHLTLHPINRLSDYTEILLTE